MDDPLLAMAQQIQGGGPSAPASAAAPASPPASKAPADDGELNILVTGPARDPLLEMAQKVQASKDSAPGTPQSAAPAQPGSLAGELGRQLGLTARAAGHGVADAVDTIGAPLNATINTLFGAHLHNPGDAIRAGIDAITPAPQNALERIINSGTGAMASGALGAGAAAGVARMAASPLPQAIASQMAQAPGVQMAAGAGAGSASQGAQESGASPLVQMGAGMLGGLAGGAAGAGVAAGANALRSAIARPAEAVRVEPGIGPQAAPTGAPNPQPAPGDGGGANAASGRGSVGAAGTNYAEQARASGVPDEIVQRIAAQEAAGKINPTAAERHIEAGSLPVPVELTAGQATGDVNTLSHEQNIRGKAPELAERFNAQNGQLAANFDAIRDQVAPDVNVPSGSGIGQALVDAYKQMDAPVQQRISDAYSAARNADGTSARVDAGQAMRDFESQMTPARFRALPGRVQQMFAEGKSGNVEIPTAFDQYGSGSRPMTALDLMDIDQALSGEIAQTKNPSVAHDIGQLREAFSNAAISPSAGADAVASFKEAQAMSRARFQAMDADPAYKASVGDGVNVGAPSPLADQFVQKYIAGGGGKAANANVQNMLQNLSGDPLNQQLMAAGLIDHIKQQAGIDLRTNTGNVSQAGLNKALSNLDQKTALVLGAPTAQTLETLGNVARYTQEQPRGSYVNNSNTFVAGAANAAKSAVEGAINVAMHGVPVGTWARDALGKRSLGREVSEALEPGAGLNRLQSATGVRQ